MSVQSNKQQIYNRVRSTCLKVKVNIKSSNRSRHTETSEDMSVGANDVIDCRRVTNK